MALLRNLEQSLSGLLEGTVGRVFRTEVRPTEIARKLAREMEINKRVSLSRTYAPTDYLVYLSPDDRARYAGVEQSIAEELGAYLLEHARRERLVLVRRPLVEFRTDQRLRMGEFGIEARTAPISAAEAPARDEQQGERDARPLRREEQILRPPADERAAQQFDDRPDPEPGPDFHPAMPLGSVPEPEADSEPAAPFDDLVEPPYEDPYAAEAFGAPPEPEPHELDDWDDEPAPPEPAAAEPDWLEPVDAWLPEPAAAPHEPVAQAPVPPAPAPIPVRPAAEPPAAGAPWIDPTLAQHPPRPTKPPPVVPPRQTGATLLVDGTAHPLPGDRVILGRSRTADIVIGDPSVSRQHVELRRDDRGWYAVDLGSTNGTTVDGTAVTEPRRLEPGMLLKVGHAPAIIEVR